jgi:hypothetical protein
MDRAGRCAGADKQAIDNQGILKRACAKDGQGGGRRHLLFVAFSVMGG